MFAFNRNLRLKTKFDFETVKKAKQKLYRDGFFLNLCSNNKKTPRLGLIITKKQINRAVDRNHLKRIIKESFRLNQHRLFHFDIIVIAQKQCLQMTDSELRYCLNRLWEKLITFQLK